MMGCCAAILRTHWFFSAAFHFAPTLMVLSWVHRGAAFNQLYSESFHKGVNHFSVPYKIYLLQMYKYI